MAKYEGEERRESHLTVKWWWVLGTFILIFGFFFTAILNHENRITKQETSTAYIVKSIDELKVVAKENNDLIRRSLTKDSR